MQRNKFYYFKYYIQLTTKWFYLALINIMWSFHDYNIKIKL